jgi:methylamine dehydrogenase heavy chain
MAVTADGRYALVQSATPATSVTVVDLPAKRVAGEISVPGCWGIIPWPQQPRRFSSLCGDGTLATLELADDGGSAKTSTSAAFFDPDADPLFLHFETVGKQLFLVSYLGKVHGVTLEEDGPHFAAPWSLVSAQEAKANWRPGGYELFSVDEQGSRLYIGMHDHGRDGSHKDPSRQVWVFDLATHKHLGSGAGHGAISLALEKGPQPHLYVLDGDKNEVLAFDPAGDPALKKPLARFEKAGDTPITVRTQ